MPWVIVFVICWILFFCFVDSKMLRENIFGGLVAVGMATIVDCGAQHLSLYEFYNLIISWAGCPIFYIFGPIFTMGILFVQFIPPGKWLKTIHIIVFSFTFAVMDYLTVQINTARYIHWHSLASFFVNILSFCTLTWIATTFIREKKY